MDLKLGVNLFNLEKFLFSVFESRKCLKKSIIIIIMEILCGRVGNLN